MHRDAISNICRQQMDSIATWARTQSIPLQIKLYVSHTDVNDSRIFQVPNLLSLAVDDHFLRSDLILFHFGIYHELFDAIQLAPRTARTVVNFYGITPPFLFPDDEGQRALINQSYRQAVNLRAADQIFATSSILLDDLHANLSIPRAKLIRMPPCASFESVEGARPAPNSDAEISLICIGRFVRQKGLHDLLEAIRQHRDADRRKVRLRLVGSRRWADEKYLGELSGFVERHGLREWVEFEFDISTAALRERLCSADALVTPSYHEGFCVPVIEALNCGRFVIASDAGALPETTGGLGRTFPTGDVPALASRIQEFCESYPDGMPTDSGLLSRSIWLERATQYVEQFTRECHDQRLCSTLFANLDLRVNETQKSAAASRRETILGIARQQVSPPVNLKAVSLLREVSLPYTVSGGPVIHEEKKKMRTPAKIRRELGRVGKEIGRFWSRIKRGYYTQKVSRALHLRDDKPRTDPTPAANVLDSLSDVLLAQSRRLASQEAALAAQNKLLESLKAEMGKLSRRFDPAHPVPKPMSVSHGATIQAKAS